MHHNMTSTNSQHYYTHKNDASNAQENMNVHNNLGAHNQQTYASSHTHENYLKNHSQYQHGANNEQYQHYGHTNGDIHASALSSSAKQSTNQSNINLSNALVGGPSPTSTVWTNQCVDLEKIIRYFRTNDYSAFDNETRLLVNTIRDICIDTTPLDVNVVKRFDSDENLMRHYERLVKEGGGFVVPQNIFVQSFIDHVLPSYAQKFYNKGGMTLSESSKAEAARQLGLAVQYQVAQAVTSSIPIPLPLTQQLANNYMTLLLKQAQIPPNIQQAVSSRKYNQLNNINDLINKVIDNIFAGESDYYYYVLNDKNRSRITSLKENLTYLGALSETNNIFEFIAEMATRRGKQPGLFREVYNITTSTKKPISGILTSNATNIEAIHEHYRRSLTEMAFQNEALRRFIFQQLSYKTNKQ
ncbi:GP41 [Buzura suppressaria nucleopolyhedrovirus]|uniref:GP41 n=1 Tax=Buzura suppressaria nuclear polyhedrosis virus TaxID=74320 RepID=W5VS71_NPVBS|nr:GP41 [Buzura suppressaria nucleopolyhedrovirus]AHH82652.1 GP41 [Buzura suppressaria nucleopolyhedrovirus]AKN91035.1 GP41 [Buzura suppressaria nucleopolyhedrovirus]QYF10624.1 tegument protein glycoprotein-41 [Buzura suppressaria nucleopolyhedrovirus]